MTPPASSGHVARTLKMFVFNPDPKNPKTMKNPTRCEANTAHMIHEKPDSGLGFQVKVIKRFEAVLWETGKACHVGCFFSDSCRQLSKLALDVPSDFEFGATGRSCITPPASSGHVARTSAMFGL